MPGTPRWSADRRSGWRTGRTSRPCRAGRTARAPSGWSDRRRRSWCRPEPWSAERRRARAWGLRRPSASPPQPASSRAAVTATAATAPARRVRRMFRVLDMAESLSNQALRKMSVAGFTTGGRWLRSGRRGRAAGRVRGVRRGWPGGPRRCGGRRRRSGARPGRAGSSGRRRGRVRRCAAGTSGSVRRTGRCRWSRTGRRSRCCSASRKLITRLVALLIVGQLDAVVAIENETSGGSRLTETSEVAVNPTGPWPASAVITTTPAAWRRKTERKTFASTVFSSRRSGTTDSRVFWAGSSAWTDMSLPRDGAGTTGSGQAGAPRPGGVDSAGLRGATVRRTAYEAAGTAVVSDRWRWRCASGR